MSSPLAENSPPIRLFPRVSSLCGYVHAAPLSGAPLILALPPFIHVGGTQTRYAANRGTRLSIKCWTSAFVLLSISDSTVREETFAGSDHVLITVAISDSELIIHYCPQQPSENATNVYVALGTHRQTGAAILPFAQHREGSTVFLPFMSDLILSAEVRSHKVTCFKRDWENWKWGDRKQTDDFDVAIEESALVFRIPRAILGASSSSVDFVIYAKDPASQGGWGWFWGCSHRNVQAGGGDKYIPHYHEIKLESKKGPLATRRSRYGSAQSRMRIYQLFVRLFGNTNANRKRNGTLIENGVGKFEDINETALASLAEMGFSHLWLTGVLQQATGTDYSAIGRPSDDPDLLKGIAGSPYAIKDYFDVCADYAHEPANRLIEFKALIDRIHARGLKVLIDFVPNHVARSYHSVVRPELDFGVNGRGGSGDDRSKFFDPQNNFFYLQLGNDGPPLRLPTWRDGQPLSPTCAIEGMHCDGLFDRELTHGKVTGNNAATWTPSLIDWYETVKLNYGFDFTDGAKVNREYPSAIAPDKPVPDTWAKMDRVLAYWQDFGIDGFRCDMAHMVPPEFWAWLISLARSRSAEVVFIAEAYDNDPTKAPGSDPVVSRLNWGIGNVKFDLLNAGFNAVYDDPTYKALKNIYDGPGWANDIDDSLGDPYIFDYSLRYAENHDEVRLAAASQWQSIGMRVGLPVAAILYGLSRGPIMVYNGQEVGERGLGAEGFGGDGLRTSIFDYGSMPELAKWVNHHRYDGGELSGEQIDLRSFYRQLVRLTNDPAFRDGEFSSLNRVNRDNPDYGRLPGEGASGHWLYGFLRYDVSSEQRFLVLVNLHSATALLNVRVMLPRSALEFLDLIECSRETTIKLTDQLSAVRPIELFSTVSDASGPGILVPEIPPLTPFYLMLTIGLYHWLGRGRCDI